MHDECAAPRFRHAINEPIEAFFAILVVLTTTNHWLGLEKDGPDHRRIRDAFLEPWTRFATRRQVTAAFELAYPLAMVNRALSWQQGTGALSQSDKKEYADYVPGWLQEYLSHLNDHHF